MCIEKAKPETKPKKRIPPEPMTSKKHVLININDFCAAQKPVRLPFVKCKSIFGNLYCWSVSKRK